MREVVSTLQREPHECVSDTTRVYLRDLYDHVIQIIDIIEIYREIASDLTETYMSSVSNRMNEIMKVLTMIGTIFIPLTFLAGVYGMNFRYFPELDQAWAYPAFWGVCFIAGRCHGRVVPPAQMDVIEYLNGSAEPFSRRQPIGV